MSRPWKITASRVVYVNPWIRLREDRFLCPDSSEGIYGVVEVRPSVGILALNPRGELALVGQWRYPRGNYSWEIPRGGSHPDESDMRVVAGRELREEVGITAASWESLGTLDVNNGITDDVQHLFIATDLAPAGKAPDPSEDLTTRWVPFDTAVRMVLDGEITECCSVAAILKLNALGRTGQPTSS